MSVPIKVFIISWKGRHANASVIARQILTAFDDVTVIYSDPDPNTVPQALCPVVRRPNELFWEDKFKACMDACGESGALVIHADCMCADWEELVTTCITATERQPDIGVWAPRIHGTPYDLAESKIMKVTGTSLNIAALTDGIVFYLSPPVVARMRQVAYGSNLFGWGIDLMFCAAAYAMDTWVVIDDSVEVFHPQNITGYDAKDAASSMQGFLQQLSMKERIQCELLVGFVSAKRHPVVPARPRM